MNRHACEGKPMHRPLGDCNFIIPYEVYLFPYTAKEPIYILYPKVMGTFKPIGSQNSHIKVYYFELIFFQIIIE
eukprot:Gb_19759 [translate_table: standard]